MGIQRYYMDKDCDITNAYKDDFVYSGTLSNDGRADSLQVFSIYNQSGFETSTAYNRKSRILLSIDFSQLYQDIYVNKSVPYNVNNQYWLRLFNVKHHENLPAGFTLEVMPLSRSFNEGLGLDQDNFADLDEANWIYASTGTLWTNEGGDFYSASSTYIKSQYFEKGDEDLEINITDIINDFYFSTSSGFPSLYGIGIKLSSSYENVDVSYYKKKFSSRSSEYFFKRPILEARWDSIIQDDRKNSFTSASIASTENLNDLYFYNNLRGQLTDIPGIGTGSSIYVSFYTQSSGSGSALAIFTGSWYATGTYRVQFYSTFTGTLYDFWRNLAGTVTYYSSSVSMKSFYEDSISSNDKFSISMPFLKNEYDRIENPKMNIFVKRKNYQPNYYTRYQPNPENLIIENCYYQVKRVVDDLTVISYGTGSFEYTKLSFDTNGNYFYLPMSLFESGFMYEISYLFKFGTSYVEQLEKFKFKVI